MRSRTALAYRAGVDNDTRQHVPSRWRVIGRGRPVGAGRGAGLRHVRRRRSTSPSAGDSTRWRSCSCSPGRSRCCSCDATPSAVLWFVAGVTLVYLLRGYAVRPGGPQPGRRPGRGRACAGTGRPPGSPPAPSTSATSRCGTLVPRRRLVVGSGAGCRRLDAGDPGRRRGRPGAPRTRASPPGRPAPRPNAGRPTRSGCASPASCTTSSPTTCR